MNQELTKRHEAILRLINELHNGGGYLPWVYGMIRNILYPGLTKLYSYPDAPLQPITGKQSKQFAKSDPIRKKIVVEIRRSINWLAKEEYLLKEGKGNYSAVHITEKGQTFCSENPVKVWQNKLLQKPKRKRITSKKIKFE